MHSRLLLTLNTSSVDYRDHFDGCTSLLELCDHELLDYSMALLLRIYSRRVINRASLSSGVSLAIRSLYSSLLRLSLSCLRLSESISHSRARTRHTRVPPSNLPLTNRSMDRTMVSSCTCKVLVFYRF